MDSSESDNTQFSNYQNRDDQEPAGEPKKHTKRGLNTMSATSTCTRAMNQEERNTKSNWVGKSIKITKY